MLSKTLALVSALLFTSLAAVAATESNAPRPVASSSRATIHCLGTGSVPMTVDAEQRPPLQVVGDLPCGSVVSVLADDESYTTQVRTEEGVDGYVVRSYLTENGVIASDRNPQPISASPADGVVRWRSGSPGCAQFVSNGHLVESATANDVTVQVALEDTGWKLRAIVAVSNNGRETIEVLSSLVTLDERSPGLKSLPPSDPLKLSHVVNHQLLLSEANALPPSGADTLLDSARGLTPAAYQPSTPDYFGDNVFRVSSSNSAAILPSRTQIESLALRDKALKPGQVASGVIWFERSAHARELTLHVAIGDLAFDFPMAFDERK